MIPLKVWRHFSVAPSMLPKDILAILVYTMLVLVRFPFEWYMKTMIKAKRDHKHMF